MIVLHMQADSAERSDKAVRPIRFSARFHHVKPGQHSTIASEIGDYARRAISWVRDRIAQGLNVAFNTGAVSAAEPTVKINTWRPGFVQAQQKHVRRAAKEGSSKEISVPNAQEPLLYQEPETLKELETPSPSSDTQEDMALPVEPRDNKETLQSPAVSESQPERTEQEVVPSQSVPEKTIADITLSHKVRRGRKNKRVRPKVKKPPRLRRKGRKKRNATAPTEVLQEKESPIIFSAEEKQLLEKGLSRREHVLPHKEKHDLDTMKDLPEQESGISQKEELSVLEKEVLPIRKHSSTKKRPKEDALQETDFFDDSLPPPSSSLSNQLPTFPAMSGYQQQQSMPFVTAPVYPSNQQQLNNIAMQMQSSAMAMQAQAASLMAQAQQQQLWPQQQVVQPSLPIRDQTKQEKTAAVMQALQQVINAGEGAAQQLLLTLDHEFDILEHLLAGNRGQLVEAALKERNNLLRQSNPHVVAAYDRLMELATTYGAQDDVGGRVYHYCVRKSKQRKASSIISRAKKQFLLHMMCVLERYYEIIEKMQQAAKISF